MPINRLIPGTNHRVTETGTRNAIMPGLNHRLAETVAAGGVVTATSATESSPQTATASAKIGTASAAVESSAQSVASSAKIGAASAASEATAWLSNAFGKIALVTALSGVGVSCATVAGPLGITTATSASESSGESANQAGKIGAGSALSVLGASSASSYTVIFPDSELPRTNRGGGWETYVAPQRKKPSKSLKKLKQEYEPLSWFEIEQKEEEVKSEIKSAEGEIKLNQGLGLNDVINQLKVAIELKKIELKAIEAVKKKRIEAINDSENEEDNEEDVENDLVYIVAYLMEDDDD